MLPTILPIYQGRRHERTNCTVWSVHGICRKCIPMVIYYPSTDMCAFFIMSIKDTHDESSTELAVCSISILSWSNPNQLIFWICLIETDVEALEKTVFPE